EWYQTLDGPEKDFEACVNIGRSAALLRGAGALVCRCQHLALGVVEDTLELLDKHLPEDHPVHVHCFTSSLGLANSLLERFP
ncbi:hypothetical protein AK812_SmicGene45248, partial [Symbiodinium microadriaticum]